MSDLPDDAAPAAATAEAMPASPALPESAVIELGPTAEPQGDPVPASSVLPEAAVEEFGLEPGPVPEATHPFIAVIDQWVADCIHNSPVSYATDAYNHLTKALVELKQRITKEI